MALKKLPIGIQTFSTIINENYTYVDKTGIAYNLIDKYKYVFLSRPRRFGKSLFVDTLRNIFEGNKELFSGLEIENKWNWDKKYPVIQLNFAKGFIESREDLNRAIIRTLQDNQKRLGIDCDKELSPEDCFNNLIQDCYKKYNEKVVILVDEYDKPLLDSISNEDAANDIRNGLVNLYSVIKGSDEFIQFAFLTGVSKFAKTSIFSG